MRNSSTANQPFFLSEEQIEEIIQQLAEEEPPQTSDEERIFMAGRRTVYKTILSNFIAEPFADEQVCRLWDEIHSHRDLLNRQLNRNVGFRVAAMDYLFNIKKLLTNPTILDNSRYTELVNETRMDIKTGIYNARSFFQITDREIERSSRYGLYFSLLLLDMDRFKQFNDTEGHIAGDRLILALSEILKSELRNVDFAGRFGGDEFCILLPQTSRWDATLTAQRIQQGFARMFQQRFSTAPQVTLSIGIAVFPFHRRRRQELFKEADRALYCAKHNGRNRTETDTTKCPALILKESYELVITTGEQRSYIFKRFTMDERVFCLSWPEASPPRSLQITLRSGHDSYHTVMDEHNTTLNDGNLLEIPFNGIEELQRKLLTCAVFTE